MYYFDTQEVYLSIKLIHEQICRVSISYYILTTFFSYINYNDSILTTIGEKNKALEFTLIAFILSSIQHRLF